MVDLSSLRPFGMFICKHGAHSLNGLRRQWRPHLAFLGLHRVVSASSRFNAAVVASLLLCVHTVFINHIFSSKPIQLLSPWSCPTRDVLVFMLNIQRSRVKPTQVIPLVYLSRASSLSRVGVATQTSPLV
ncbi:hypothetical protein F2P81_005898 [Scophthalmus maximus]|uniref:Uncharacterized protein n=1 Tax=Scophthalmus maximus TaxID=52904 RepID=A0A6A4T4C5_SCOMX|nr:hypothetical protein F2P81_005898 [Scophthalmus maximus]